MASVLQQLENNDAVLLMYLADELPAEDRAEVERMLSVDPGLRAELERLRAATAWVAGEIARDDRATRLPASEAAAVRRVGRSMRQWHARRLAEAPEEPAPASNLRYPWWAYPLAAAASVVIAFLVWWGNTDRPPAVAQRDPGEYGIIHSTPLERAQALGDPNLMANYRAELIARSLGLEYGPDGYGAPYNPYGAYGASGASGMADSMQPDWDESSDVYAAVAPTDANVLMFLDNPGGDGDAPGPDDEAVN